MFKEYILKNNLTVIYERLDHLKSVSFGVWIGAGARYETRGNNGISHFIEHMVFKGTKTRTAKDIACEIDKIGGEINAFTGKDCTCFYTKTLNSDLEIAVDILSDMLLNPVFNPDHIETEKKVVLEEISMYEDDPEELVNDLLSEEMWNGSPLGFPILGTAASLEGITREDLLDYMSLYYVPDNCVISVAGNFEEDYLINVIDKYFGSWKPLGYCNISNERPALAARFLFRKKEIEQTHLSIGFRGFPIEDQRMYALMALNNIIGGGMSSRLFQSIREELGLVYSIYSFPISFRDCGMFTIYAATNPEKVNTVIECIGNELRNLIQHGITQSELLRSKNQLKGNYCLSLDSTSGLMTAIGKSIIITGKVHDPEEVLKRIDSITMNDILDIINWIFKEGEKGMVALGERPVSPDVMNYLTF
ncbi:MAG: insulinase family protein [Clostridiaceae bacterium]|nr:insulinase family protein [Clostridiaceae bacterium]